MTVESLGRVEGTSFVTQAWLVLFSRVQGNLCQWPLGEFHVSKVDASGLIALVIHFQVINQERTVLSNQHLSSLSLSASYSLPLSEGRLPRCKQEERRELPVLGVNERQ